MVKINEFYESVVTMGWYNNGPQRVHYHLLVQGVSWHAVDDYQLMYLKQFSEYSSVLSGRTYTYNTTTVRVKDDP